jgi:hypothetical protein
MAYVVIDLMTGDECGFRPTDLMYYSEFPTESAAEIILDLCLANYNSAADRLGYNKKLKEEFIIINRTLPASYMEIYGVGSVVSNNK